MASFVVCLANAKYEIREHAVAYGLGTALAVSLLVFGILARFQVGAFQNISRLSSNCMMTAGGALIIAELFILFIKSYYLVEPPATPRKNSVTVDVANLNPPLEEVIKFEELQDFAAHLPLVSYCAYSFDGKVLYCYRKSETDWRFNLSKAQVNALDTPSCRHTYYSKDGLSQIINNFSPKGGKLTEEQSWDYTSYLPDRGYLVFVDSKSGIETVLIRDGAVLKPMSLAGFNEKGLTSSYKLYSLMDLRKARIMVQLKYDKDGRTEASQEGTNEQVGSLVGSLAGSPISSPGPVASRPSGASLASPSPPTPESEPEHKS